MAENKQVVQDDPNIIGDGTVVQEAKHILESKTVWVNAIALLAFWVQKHYGFAIDESLQIQILTAVNIGLRSVTKDAVRWTTKKSQVDNGE
jgi:hypothetical protein